MTTSPLAGKPAPPSLLVDVPKLITAYYVEIPDSSIPEQRVAFGTSGHRGSSIKRSFNEWHILATTQAICDLRRRLRIDGPLFVGIDTHALSVPAFATAVEVLAANEVQLMISENDETTPTPAVSHAILTYNRGRKGGLADGIVVTPSHNPPEDGGFKYNPPHGGPAESDLTRQIESSANALLENRVQQVKRIPFARALSAATTRRHDYADAYVADLGNVLDLERIRSAGLKLGVDPLGGAGVRYWHRIAERYGLDLTVVDSTVDPTFRFMTVDWDGRIRMDPSSPYAMQRLSKLKDRFDIAFGCDTDHDRHGVVTRGAGLMTPNHYLSAAAYHLFTNRPSWRSETAIGKTVVTSQMLNRLAKKLGRRLYETPVGFKWFTAGLLDGSLGLGCEESAGASFLRRNGEVWATDKDGIISALLSAEITAAWHRDPAEVYQQLTQELGEPAYDRIDAPATLTQKRKLQGLTPEDVKLAELAGEKIQTVLTRAPGNDAPIGGVKVVAENGWFAVRPSGTEDVYKLYAESFKGQDHLRRILEEAQGMVAKVLGS